MGMNDRLGGGAEARERVHRTGTGEFLDYTDASTLLAYFVSVEGG